MISKCNVVSWMESQNRKKDISGKSWQNLNKVWSLVNSNELLLLIS